MALGSGLIYLLRGARFVYWRHPGLAKIWLIPIVLTVMAYACTLVLAWCYHDLWLSWLWPEPNALGWWGKTLSVLHSVVEWLLTLIVLALSWLFVTLLTSLIASPFNDWLSERVEGLVTGQEPPAFRWRLLYRSVLRAIGLEISKLGLYLMLLVLSTALALSVPVVGPLLAPALVFSLSALFFAVDYVDWPMSRRDQPLAYRWHFMRHHWRAMLGLGTGIWLLLYLPLVQLLFMPAAVAGATLMFVDLEKDASESDKPIT